MVFRVSDYDISPYLQQQQNRNFKKMKFKFHIAAYDI